VRCWFSKCRLLERILRQFKIITNPRLIYSELFLMYVARLKLMAHAQKPDFVFPRNRRVHLNRRGRQFSRLLAAELCASAEVILDTPRSEGVWEYWLPTPFASLPFTSTPPLPRGASLCAIRFQTHFTTIYVASSVGTSLSKFWTHFSLPQCLLNVPAFISTSI